MLGHPDFSEDVQQFIVTVDTLSHGVGATLSQKQRQEDGKLVERIIAYCSRKLRDGERSYSAYKLELCGLVTALEHFRYFLIGKPFKVRTDHRALQWLMKPRHNQALPLLLWRWHQWIAEYQYEIEWVSKMVILVQWMCHILSEIHCGPATPPWKTHKNVMTMNFGSTS